MKHIVYTPGVWDILHVGHLNLVRRASLCGDHLIVGVCSDQLVSLHKGSPPTMNEHERATIIGALRDVDEVYIYDNPNQSDALAMFVANTFVIGEQFGSQGVSEHQLALSYCLDQGIAVVRVPRYPNVSSSEYKT